MPPDVHAMAAYFADGTEDDHAQLADGSTAEGGAGKKLHISFDSRLGLAIESMPDGVTMDTLWRVI